MASTTDQRPVVGVVAQDKAAGSREILVYPPDTLPYLQGKLKPKAQKVDLNIEDGHQGNSVGQATETNVVRAVFRGDATSDLPPDVVAGEEVELIRDTDTNTLFWSASGRTTNIRERERKEIRAANQAGAVKQLDDGNSYLIRIDTLTTKEIRIQTSMSDGEEFAYTILINPKESNVTICDNVNNEITLDSKNTHIYMRNKDESIISMNKKTIFIGAPEQIILKGEKQVVVDTPNFTHQNNSGDGCTVINTKGLQINADTGFVVNTPCIGMHGAMEADSIVAGPVQTESLTNGKY